MTDTKTILMKKELIATFQKRIAGMKPGEEIKAAELVFMSLNAGFSYNVVKHFLESYKDLGVVELFYKDQRIYLVKKPAGAVYHV